MDKIFKVIVIFTLIYFAGCTYQPQQNPYIPEKKSVEKLEKYRPVKKNRDTPPPPLIVKPVIEEISPSRENFSVSVQIMHL
ncbi:MAG: hypothetical protein Q9M89_09715 [Persephonella sp.]|nr:hypothetical protein [Persephonella sp.]